MSRRVKAGGYGGVRREVSPYWSEDHARAWRLIYRVDEEARRLLHSGRGLGPGRDHPGRLALLGRRRDRLWRLRDEAREQARTARHK